MQTRAPSLSFVLKLIILSVLIVYGSGLLAQSSNAPCENVDDYGKSGEVVTARRNRGRSGDQTS